MRQALTLSLTPKIIQDVKSRVKKRGYPSVSEYIRYLIQDDTDVISAEELLEIAKEADKNYKEGKTIFAKSLADLI